MASEEKLEALKPCPFCGAAVNVTKDPNWIFVRCEACGCEGPDAQRHSTAEAVAAWNRRPSPSVGVGELREGSYQQRIDVWMQEMFAAGGADPRTRMDRLIEEVFELAQSGDYDPGRIAPIRDYVYGRPKGDPAQEMGGVMVTLASLACAAGIDMEAEAERELERINTPEVRAKIMAKQASKNALHTPLPTAEAAALAALSSIPVGGLENRGSVVGSADALSALPRLPQAGSATPLAEEISRVAALLSGRSFTACWNSGEAHDLVTGFGMSEAADYLASLLWRANDAIKSRPEGVAIKPEADGEVSKATQSLQTTEPKPLQHPLLRPGR
jgi:Lar family restriction alleviation protein